MFDRVFVINLDHRTDRWEKVEAELKKRNVTNYERFSAIKPSFASIPRDWYNNLVSPHKVYPHYIQGAMGCKMSHYQIIKKANENGYKNILIFEDDVEFTDISDEYFQDAWNELPSDWEMFYLSGNHIRKPIDDNKQNIVKLNATLTTHAYAINERAYGIVLQTMMNFGCEIDNYYVSVFQNHRQTAWGMKKSLATQFASYSDVLHRQVDYTGILN